MCIVRLSRYVREQTGGKKRLTPSCKLGELGKLTPVYVGGKILYVIELETDGKPWAIVKIDDGLGEIRLQVPVEVFKAAGELVVPDNVILAKGRVGFIEFTRTYKSGRVDELRPRMPVVDVTGIRVLPEEEGELVHDSES